MKWNFKKEEVQPKPEGLVSFSIAKNKICMACVQGKEEYKPVVKAFAYQESENMNEHIQALKQFVHENQLTRMDCNFILQDSDYTLSLVDTPNVARSEINSAMMWLVRDAISFPMNEAVIDSFQVPLPRIRDNVKVSYAVTIKRSIIPEIESIVKSAGLVLKYIDIPEFSLRNLAYQTPSNERGQLILELKDKGGSLIVSRSGNIYLARKLDQDFVPLMSLEQEEDDVKPLLEEVALEIQRSLDYAQGYYRQNLVNSLLILPTILNSTYIRNFLTNALGIEIFGLDLHEYLLFKQEITPIEQAHCLIALGGALREVMDRDRMERVTTD